LTENNDAIDWSITTWEGSRREQMRRAAKIPFDRILDCIEDMADISDELSGQAVDSGEGGAHTIDIIKPLSVFKDPSETLHLC